MLGGLEDQQDWAEDPSARSGNPASVPSPALCDLGQVPGPLCASFRRHPANGMDLLHPSQHPGLRKEQAGEQGVGRLTLGMCGE